jgi:hypothetical protein
MSRSDAERVPAKLPGATGSWASIEDDEVISWHESESLQVKGDGEPCLPGADDDN